MNHDDADQKLEAIFKAKVKKRYRLGLIIMRIFTAVGILVAYLCGMLNEST